MKKDKHWFEKYSKFARRKFSWLAKYNYKTKVKIKNFFSKEYIQTLIFSDLKVDTYEILLLSYMGAFLSFVFFLVFDLLILLSYGFNITNIDYFTIFLMIIVTIFVPIVIMNYLVNYPRIYSKYVRIHSLGYIPEVVSYLVMYLKLVPNLENSVKFAASESCNSLARDFRKMLWDMQIRLYDGIDDAFTGFANGWGRWSEYFKRALYLIRSSVREKSETSRIITLNRALDIALEGTRESMNNFANTLHQPTMVIYSIGIMIPLALVAMLPAAGLVGLKITIFQVFFVYDVILPVIIFFYARNILLKRPATFNPPVIPSDHPGIICIDKKRRFFYSTLLGFLIALPGVFFVFIPMIYLNNSDNVFLSFITNPNGLNSYFPVTLFMIWGFTASISSYCLSVYTPYRKIRDNIRQIEKEFSDALFILGKRISEEKSAEESFLYVANTMKGSKISEFFGKTGYNLTAMHSDLKDAIFNSDYGSLKYVYSDRIKATMRLFVEGVKKSQKAVSVSIIKIADHLKELQEIEKKIKDNLFNLTATLRSTVAVFAPLIGGVTLAITKLISSILSSLSNKIPTVSSSDITGQIPIIADQFTLENIRPEYFVLVIGIYLLELVFIIVRFTNGIDEGDDKAMYMHSLGKILPVSIFIFSITVIFGQMFFSNLSIS